MRNATASTARSAREDGDLGALCVQGQRLLQRMDAWGASQAFEQLVAGAAERVADWSEVPSLHEMVHTAVAGLGDCLALIPDSEARQGALQAIFEAYRADARARANGLTREIPFIILQRAHPAERRMLANWVRQALALGDGAAAEEAYWRLLLDLAGTERSSMEAVMAECRAAGHANLVAERLLDMDRVGEALLTARRELKDSGALLRFANSPAALGQVRAVMALVDERLGKAFDPRLADWLAERYAERGDLPRALEVRLRALKTAPGRGDYERVEALARRLGMWERLQPELARTLRHSRHEEALAELALGEGDAAQALAYVVKAPERYGADMVAQLAAYAAEESPQEAVVLYRYLLGRALSGEAEAGEAEGYLKQLRAVYDSQDALDAWEAYLEELRGRYGLKIWG